MAGRRRRWASLRPGLDQLETRQMLSATSFVGPVSDLQTLNLQLQPDSATALAPLLPMITAAGAAAQATTVSGLYQVQVPSSNLGALAQQLAANPAVQYTNPAQTLQIQQAPNDPYYTGGSQYGLNGTWGINAPTAWNTTTGSDHVIVADVDTGINDNHPDLVNNLWLNQAEIPASVRPNLTDVNGDGLITLGDLNNPVNQGPGKIVDSGNYGMITGADVIAPTSAGGWSSGSTQDGATAYPDDLIGWNFVANTNSPLDDNGHGTHTAGILGAVGNNGIGISGVNWNVQILAAKVFDSTGNASDSACVAAIEYAVDHGAKVINCSWGGAGLDPTLATAIQYANEHGVIMVCAAGNFGTNDTTTPFAPASYSAQYPNVIAVAATDSTGALAGWSNYGVGTVQVAAPGVNILSTWGSGYSYLSGTSMATPFVTGTVALVEAAHPSWSMSQVIDAVVDHTTADPNLVGKVTSGGIVNAAAAVANTDGAYVVSATPNGQGTSTSPLSAVQLTFNEEINPATFTPAQVSLTGPGGAVGGVSVTVVPGSNNHQFTIAFPAQTAGSSLTLKVGPSIQDWYGNAMDQNRNGVNGEAADQFVLTFNPPPTLDPIANQAMSAGSSLTITLGGHDPDGDTLTYSAKAVNLLYTLKTSDGLFYPGTYYYNWGGRQEKWLEGSGSSWYFILPSGAFDLWDGSSGATGTLVAQLGTAVYNDPSLLYNATNTPVPVTLAVSGNQLTITPGSGYTGAFAVSVTVSDGSATATQSFNVIVS